ncbi:Hypothetical protein A7982_10070 [Minicystis rosea]|nr:Hypothetical protein A7982_10070 [Minicystis rosea]
MNPALYQLLESHYKRRRLGLLVTAGICAVVMILAFGWGVASYVDDPPAYCGKPKARGYAACSDRHYNGVITRTVMFTGIPGLVAVIMGALAFPLRDLSQAPLIRLFTARREEIAWVYPKRTSVRRYGVEVNQIHEVVVCTIDGKRVELTMTEEDVKTAMRLMSAEAPRAATGYSQEMDVQFHRSPASVMKSAAAVPSAAARANAPTARLVLAPDCPFARIDQGVRYLGYTTESAPPAAMPMPGEPAQALWSGKGMRIAYSFDPTVYLRVLEVFGGDPQQLKGELSGVVGVPVLGPQQITGMLASPDPRTLMLGLRAAEAAGSPEDRAHFRDIVSRLQAHPDPAIAQVAQRVHGAWA